MKTFIQIITLIFWCLLSNAQQPSFCLERPKYDSIFILEKNNGGLKESYSYAISVSKDYFPNAENFNLANPIVFARKNNAFYLNVSYYFTSNDSIIRLIEYSWDLKSSKTKKLTKLFSKNQKTLSEYFKYQGIKSNRLKNDQDDWEGSSIIWENEKCYVKQFLINGQGTYRIRVLISWK